MQITHSLEVLIPMTVLIVLFYCCVILDANGYDIKWVWNKLRNKK
jgi:hypothetical protein